MLRNEKKKFGKICCICKQHQHILFTAVQYGDGVVGGGSFFCLWSRWLEWLADFELLDSHHVVKL